MSIAVELPELGESVVEGEVSRWLVKEGDRVERDQPIVEITTDKVDAEIPAPAAGVIEALLVAEGDVVEVGAVLARIDTEGSASAGSGSAAERKGEKAEKEEKEEKEAGRSAEPASAEGDEGDGDAPSPTPLARRAAESEGVDLGQVPGSGARGRVTVSDVERAGSSPAPEQRAPEAPERRAPARPAPSPAPKEGHRPAFLDYHLQPGDEVIPMTPLRRLVAEHMVTSKRVSPHVGTVAEIDMGGIVKVRDVHKRAFQEANGFSLSFLPFIVHATVRALREYPRLNASVVEDAIVEKKDIHMGIAVETEKGLVVPVVRHADRLSLAGLAQAVEDLASRARSKKLSADELKGGSFTISNPGRHGNLYGFAIINQPQVGILRMGEIVKRPVVRTVDGEDAIVIRPIMHLALSYDHRAVDGAPANGFLHRIRELLEEAEAQRSPARPQAVRSEPKASEVEMERPSGAAHETRPADGRLRPTLQIVDLGLVPYAEGLKLQAEAVEERRAGSRPDTLFLLEHPPVVTLGRGFREQNLRVPREALAGRGVEIFEASRGGDVTYHAPGQLVGYPILDLDARGERDLHAYLRRLEALLCDALRALGVPPRVVPGRTGVFVEDPDSERPRKIASIGVGARGWVTRHGFALNVDLDLAGFACIVPCGLADVEMTSVAAERGGAAPPDLALRARAEVRRAFAHHFGSRP